MGYLIHDEGIGCREIIFNFLDFKFFGFGRTTAHFTFLKIDVLKNILTDFNSIFLKETKIKYGIIWDNLI